MIILGEIIRCFSNQAPGSATGPSTFESSVYYTDALQPVQYSR